MSSRPAAERISIRHAGGVHSKRGNEVILSPRPVDWASYLVDGPLASQLFMEDIEDLAVQERER